MTKEEFIIQYVLNRAAAMSDRGGLDGPEAARMGIEAWEVIQKEIKRNPR